MDEVAAMIAAVQREIAEIREEQRKKREAQETKRQTREGDSDCADQVATMIAAIRSEIAEMKQEIERRKRRARRVCLYCRQQGHEMIECRTYETDQRHYGAFFHFRRRELSIKRRTITLSPSESPAAAVWRDREEQMKVRDEQALRKQREERKQRRAEQWTEALKHLQTAVEEHIERRSAETKGTPALFHSAEGWEAVQGEGQTKGVDEEEAKATPTFKYKPVSKKIRPQEVALPERFRLKRRKNLTALDDLPQMPIHPPEFRPHGRLTQERHDEIDWNPGEFLKEDEVKLLKWAVAAGSQARSWTVEERGKFSSKYFDPVVISTVLHEPWQEKNRSIVPGAREEVRRIVKDRMDSGVYEYSSSSY